MIVAAGDAKETTADFRRRRATGDASTSSGTRTAPSVRLLIDEEQSSVRSCSSKTTAAVSALVTTNAPLVASWAALSVPGVGSVFTVTSSTAPALAPESGSAPSAMHA